MTERLQVNMYEAQSQLSQLAERAWIGDTVVIVKDGKPSLDLGTRRRSPLRACSQFPIHHSHQPNTDLWRGGLPPLGCIAAPDPVNTS
jgi:antitoxin (DNA-binding transcriptional repressor) of toxin-antitoxin stability system